MVGAELFARHLDLAPLRGRRAGLVRCIFHEDAGPSLSVDLDKGVWHCFGCHAQGGLKAFAVRVGELVAGTVDTRATQDETPWLIMQRLAARQPWSQPALADVYALSDWIKRTRRWVAETRQAPRDWDTLAAAATLERLAHWAEHELDAIYALGPIR